MEMILDLRYRKLFALPWERSVRGCVLLIFFGVLYFCVKACPTLDEVKRERIAVDGKVNVIFGIESKDICDNKGICAFIGFQDQGASLVITNSKEIMNPICNEDISMGENIDRTLDMIMVGNNTPEIVNTTKILDNNVETSESGVKKSGMHETVITGNNVPETVTAPESSVGNIEIKEPDIEIKGPNISVKEPDIEIKEPDISVKEPDIEIKEPDISVKEPDIGIKEPDISAKEPEVTEGKEDHEPVTGENGSIENDFGDGKVIEGFSVDAQGYITGTTDNLILLDEILVIAADQGCVGIREGAFSDIEGIVTEIYIPANICDIEPGAFRFFQDLIYIEVSEENPYYYSTDGILYSSSGEKVVNPAGR